MANNIRDLGNEKNGGRLRDMLFSIVTPSFNSEKTIARTIESVLSQTYHDYEYIIIDGASTDRTLEIIESYRSRFNGKLTVISEPDNGIYDAMNKGIHLAHGQLIGIINSDDFLEDKCLEYVSKKYNPNSPYQIIYGIVRIINSDYEELALRFIHHRYLLYHGMINHSATFVSKALHEKYGAYDTQYKSAADYDFMLKMSKKSDVEFVPDYHLFSNFMLGGISGTYRGILENNEVEFRNGLISKKEFYLRKIKILVKKLLFGPKG